MNFQGTPVDAKRVASILRRELVELGLPRTALSHTQALGLLARIMGAKTWEEMQARLGGQQRAAATQPVAQASACASRYPLSNASGRFDFIANGEEGAALSCWLQPLHGSIEQLKSVYMPGTVTRKGSDVELEGGESDVDWNSQTPIVAEGTSRLWTDYAEQTWSNARIVLVPEGYMGTAETDEALPIRPALLAEYAQYFRDLGVVRPSVEQLDTAQNILGFSLTRKECAALDAVEPQLPSSTSELQAWRQVFSRVFTDEGTGHGTDVAIVNILEALENGTRGMLRTENGEWFLQSRLEGSIALNAPYERLSVTELHARLTALAKAEREKGEGTSL